MKTARFSKKLRFTKETVADLNSKDMNKAHGGKGGDTGYFDGDRVWSGPDLQSVCRTVCPSNFVPCPTC